ncbi:hypothetical protein ACE3MS_11250 [Paenibacillus dendritiformis]|uniref:hypothetical protein n=1 Tax=Paenibacillus dendritiformis TaxID=130049 RepID=UPI00365EFBEC
MSTAEWRSSSPSSAWKAAPAYRSEAPIFPESVHLEDPFVWTDGEGGYMMIAKDRTNGFRHAHHRWNMLIPIDGGIR